MASQRIQKEHHGRTRGDQTSPTARSVRGLLSQKTGLNAEDMVLRTYAMEGTALSEKRWRGLGGEIDLILRDGDVIVFCEVKTSRSRETAIQSLRPRQIQRIHAAASEYLGQTEAGQLSDVRFDLAIVDGVGRVEILKNAFGHF